MQFYFSALRNIRNDKGKENPDIIFDENSTGSVELFSSEMMAMIEEHFSRAYNDDDLISGKCIFEIVYDYT